MKKFKTCYEINSLSYLMWNSFQNQCTLCHFNKSQLVITVRRYTFQVRIIFVFVFAYVCVSGNWKISLSYLIWISKRADIYLNGNVLWAVVISYPTRVNQESPCQQPKFTQHIIARTTEAIKYYEAYSHKHKITREF